MKTKKSGVRGSVITSADLGKAIRALERYLEKRNLIVNGCPIVFGSGTPFDDALTPFDLVANGGKLRADKKVLDRFVKAWFEVAHCFKCDDVMWFYLSLVRVLKMFSISGLRDFNCGVFVSDYGYFRGVLTKCLYWNMSRIGGGSSGVISDIGDKVSGVEKSVRKTDAKASKAMAFAKGDWTEEDIKGAQVRYAVDWYVKKKSTLKSALWNTSKATEIEGRKIPVGVGYTDITLGRGFAKKVERELRDMGCWRGRSQRVKFSM